MKTISRYIMTLALLLTAVGGAWAQTPGVKPLTVPNEWNGNQSENLYINHLPKDFVATTEERARALSCPHPDPDEADVRVIFGFDESDFMNVVEFRYGEYHDDYGIQYTLGDMLYSSQQGVKWYYTTEPTIDVTTDAASKQDLFTTASFAMPTSDADVNYTLVRDMQDETNPVAFSGLPSSGNIVVKKGDDGKYQPAEALTIQLIDPLAAAEAQNIIAADGITVKVLVGNGGTPIEYDQEPPITLADFLADMKPGYYWIKAESTDENSPYDGTVYSSQFTVVEQYDLTVKPANDFSKNGLDAVTVGSQSVTIDANTGKATKTGIAPDTEVKIKAKRGYVIEKVEAKKKVPAEGHALTSAKFGEIVGSDGKAYAADDKDNLPSGVTAVAKICYVSDGHGLALALTDEGDMNWNTAQTTCAAHTPAITGGTWKLATKDEWDNMINASGYTSLRDGFSSVGGTNMQSDFYWSSTTISYGAWYYTFDSGRWNNGGKSATQYVRACLAF